MNRQPQGAPPRRWEAKLSPFWVRMLRPWRNRTLWRLKIRRVDVRGVERLQPLLACGAGILLTPNHSFHYDSYVLFEAAHRLGCLFQVLTAWQVFAMSGRWDRWLLQRHGCFSVDRDGLDLAAFKRCVEILQREPTPLVVFPEGEIHHTNDRVMPFLEGAAAMAAAAARRVPRAVYCVPTAIRARYIVDPTPQLAELADRLERHLLWRPSPEIPLVDRIARIASGVLALKEIEYLGAPAAGDVAARKERLADAVLRRHEAAWGIQAEEPASGAVAGRLKELRRRIHARLGERERPPEERKACAQALDDLFLVQQLASYPSHYLAERPSIERIAETLDKLEEDLFGTAYPGVRGEREAVVEFGEPVLVPAEGGRDGAGRLTALLQSRVQAMLDALSVEASAAN